MRMDENVSPEWMQQCQGSKSGRRALQEIERLTARVKVLESDDHEWYLQADRIEKLEADQGAYEERIAELEAALVEIRDYPEWEDGRLDSMEAIAREALQEDKP